jgi:hypothetical protein
MEETTFFEYDDVKVTNSRFISGNQTYAMSNVTSVKAYEKKPNRLWGIIGVVLGLVVAGAGPEPDGGIIGIIIAALAGIYLYMQKTIYHVMLATSGGETSALKTYQRNYLDKVVSALNQAIVSRG